MKPVLMVFLATVALAGCESTAVASQSGKVAKGSEGAPELRGLTSAQREVVVEALGAGPDCGAGCGGACKGESCPVRAVRLQRAAELARSGKTAAEIQAELGPCGCGGGQGSAQRPTSGAPAEAKQVTVPTDAPQRGPRTAKVTVVVFSDFQCPYCARGEQVMKRLTETYGDHVRVVFRNKPLPMHEAARPAAAAALAAHEQGRFWEYHDLLFAHQGALDRAALEGYAQRLGLDMVRFRAALDSGRFDTVISADVAEAARLGVTGTPTFFVNGRAVVGAQPFEVFKALVDEELAKG